MNADKLQELDVMPKVLCVPSCNYLKGCLLCRGRYIELAPPLGPNPRVSTGAGLLMESIKFMSEGLASKKYTDTP